MTIKTRMRRVAGKGLRKLNEKAGQMAKPQGAQPTEEKALIARDVSKGLAVVDDILNCSDEEFHSRSYILSKVLEFGLCRMPWRAWSRWCDNMNSSKFGHQQIPTEFTDYLMTLSRLKISTAAEIGVFWGASSYLAAAVLQRANPDIVYTMIDIQDRLVAFDQFSAKLNLKKAAPSTSDNFAGEVFDYVFIDGDHSFMGAKKDYLNMGRHARVAVGFHDIHAHEYDKHDGGTVRLWEEVKTAALLDNYVYEFAHNPKRWMGIGLLVRDPSAQG